MPEEKKGGDPEKVGDEAKAAPAAVPAASPKNGKPGKKKSLCDKEYLSPIHVQTTVFQWFSFVLIHKECEKKNYIYS